MNAPSFFLRPRARLRRHIAQRRSVAAWLALSVGALSTIACSRDKPRYDVLLVTLDTTRADYIGAYGRGGSITPNIDAIAAQGTRFDLAISSAAVTPVSHASILTGLYPMEHGLRVLSAEGGYKLAPDVPTLATVLHDQGWQTAAIHSAFPVSAHFGLDRGFDVFESFEAEVQVTPGQHFWDVTKYQRRSDQTTDLVLDYLKHSKAPRFVWVHYWDPHDASRIPPKEFLPPDLPRAANGQIAPSKELYAAEVHFVDHQFGRLVQALKDEGRFDHTIIVIVADHGEGLGDHGWEHHRILYQEQIRVPLIVRVPGVTQAANVTDLVRTIDIEPTVVDYLGLANPRKTSGKSLRALIERQADAPRVAYADQINSFDLNAGMVKSRPLDDFLYCAMNADWKLIYRPTHPDASELYDIAHDPHEAHDLFHAKTEQARALEAELARFNGWVLEPFAPLPASGDMHAAREALNTLGYTGDGEVRAHAGGWAWTCPAHPAVLADEHGRCPKCSEQLILIASKAPYKLETLAPYLSGTLGGG